MQVVCVRPFGGAAPGDVAEVPDGAAVDPWHWRPLADGEAAEPEPEPDAAPETAPESTAPAPAVSPVTATEM